MAKTGIGMNKYGVPVSTHICDDCGHEFTVCPPAGDGWGGCLSGGCESYDINRDVDALLFFGCRIYKQETEAPAAQQEKEDVR